MSLTLIRGINRLGLFTGIKTYLKISKRRKILKLPELAHPINLRSEPSDYLILKQIFMHGEYDIPFSFNPQYIIDGGASIGLFAILFATRFKNASIVAIEPQRTKFQQLELNTGYYNNITAVQATIWNKLCNLEILISGSEDWSFYVTEIAAMRGALNALSINHIMKMYSWPYIDIVKLDVGGSEQRIFEDNYQWIPKTKVIIIELHDQHFPNSSHTFRVAMAKYNFAETQHGESLIFTNQSPVDIS